MKYISIFTIRLLFLITTELIQHQQYVTVVSFVPTIYHQYHWNSNNIHRIRQQQEVLLFEESSSSTISRKNYLPTYHRMNLASSSSLLVLYMGRRITIRIVGRKKQGGGDISGASDQWVEDACEMYIKRLKPVGFDIITEWYKTNDALMKVMTTTTNSGQEGGGGGNGPMTVLLDPTGFRCTSEVFTDHVYDWLQEGGSRLIFVIGGADGLPKELKDGTSSKKKPILISLSDLTFTHQFARLVLIEQIYRATEIRKGSGYHK